MFELDEIKPKIPVTRKPFYSRSLEDLQATALSINYDGSFLLLAGRRHLALQNLNNLNDDLKLFHRNSKFEVSCAEFAICERSANNCAIATSQLIQVVTWRESDPL